MVIGSGLAEENLGSVEELTPDLRDKLTEPGTIVIDESERDRLGIKKIGDYGEISRSASAWSARSRG